MVDLINKVYELPCPVWTRGQAGHRVWGEWIVISVPTLPGCNDKGVNINCAYYQSKRIELTVAKIFRKFEGVG
jgi:hypothetical protein